MAVKRESHRRGAGASRAAKRRQVKDGARSKRGKLTRAKIRHFLFTVAPDRLMRGLLKRRHLACPIDLREVTVHVPSWPEAWEGLRIAHVSDFHLGELMPLDRALDLIDRVAKARPDMLACTGDVVDLEWHGSEPLLAAMGAVPARFGRYLVLGNHDHLDDPKALARAAAREGLRVLDGDVDELPREPKPRGGRGGRAAIESRAALARSAPSAAAGAGAHGAEAPAHERTELRIGGIDWGRTKKELAARVTSLKATPDLLLAHNPKAFAAAVRLGVPLTLAGHTHGGQMSLPTRTILPRPRATPVVDATAMVSHELAPTHGDAIGAIDPGLPGDPGSEARPRHAALARNRVRALRRGLYAQGQSRLFINVGAGSWFPARVNCPAEVVMLTVVR